MLLKNKKTNKRLMSSVLLLLCAVFTVNIGSVSVSAKETMQAYSYGEAVYIGGMPIGVTINLDALVVIDIGDVVTECGSNAPAKNAGLQVGDLILTANGKRMLSCELLTEVVKNSDTVTLTVRRGGSEFSVNVQPAIDRVSKNKRLGLWVRDNTAGIGTMTFMRENGEFAALGHPIINQHSGSIIKVSDGKVYSARIVGISKGKAGQAGELKGIIKKDEGVIGEISENNQYGIYGKVKGRIKNNLMDEPVTASGRGCAKVGKAKILTTIDGEKPAFYDIEIVKCVKQKKRADKSMVLKVTDKRLLERSGGIVQGMSGSPIIQEGKLIGAVTHVFINDPTRGYGIYIDWML